MFFFSTTVLIFEEVPGVSRTAEAIALTSFKFFGEQFHEQIDII